MLKAIVGLSMWQAGVLGLALLAQELVPLRRNYTALVAYSDVTLPYLWWIWANFDGIHYLQIAHRGYELLEQPFFPLFPIFISGMSEFFHLQFLVAGVITAHLFFGLAMVVLLRLLTLDGLSRHTALFVAVVLTFPTSFYYGAVYNDSLFLLLASLTLLEGRQHRWLPASLWGALATLTRLNGLALAIYLAAEYIQFQSGQAPWNWAWRHLVTLSLTVIDPRAWWRTHIWVVSLIPLAFISYLLYVQFSVHDWRMVFSTMTIWDVQGVVFPPQVVWRYLKIFWFSSPHLLNYWVAVTELASVILYGFISAWAWKKIHWPYWVFMVVSLIIPALTGTFEGMPRYALHLYPVFLSLTMWLSARSVGFKANYFLASLLVLGWCLALFTRGYFIS